MRKSPAFFIIVLALAAIILAPCGGARAQDPREGPTEINQCQTISQPGSYKIVNNLTFTGLTGTCLSITASFVTIDLAGFTISSTHESTTAIAAGDNTTGITVQNGSISGFTIGVELDGNSSIVEGLRVGGIRGASIFGIAANGIVRGNTVVDVTGGALIGVGIFATGVVTGNYTDSNRFAGIRVNQGSTVIGNTATNSFDGYGMIVACPSNVTNNTVVNNHSTNLFFIPGTTGCNNTNNVAP